MRPRWAPACLVLASTTFAACASDDGARAPDRASLHAEFPSHAARVLAPGAALIETEDGFAPEGDRPVAIELPRDAREPVRMRSRSCAIAVREVGLEGDGERVQGAVAYRRAGGASYWSAIARGAEEWLHLGAVRAGAVVAAWDVEGAALRQRDAVVEIVGDAGESCLVVSAPEAFALGGAPLGVRVEARGSRVELFVDADAEGALIDPMWSQVGSMALGRSRMGAALLDSGKVLVTGGTAVNPSPAELYDPTTATFSPTGAMTYRRFELTATKLQTGKVLVTGGYLGSITPIESEIYDPAAGTFTLGGSMTTSRASHTATLLPNGKVLIAGGLPPGTVGTALLSCEVYDPVAGTFAPTGSLSIPRVYHTATLLPNGRVLVAGGSTPVGGVLVATETAEIYDPSMGLWSAAMPMGLARYAHTATRLANGSVLVVGGNGAAITKTAEIYDPTTGAWTPAAPMTFGRFQHTATLLGSGRVLVVGGSGTGTPLPGNSAEIFDPVTGAWTFAGNLVTSHALATATRLADGHVLVAGGQTFISELYDPTSPNGAPCSVGGECTSGFCADGVCCSTACNAGACDACSVAAGAQIDGICYPLTGNPCDDGDKCSVGDVCNAGACMSGTPKACPPTDQCHLPGTCDPFNGLCDDPKKPEGTACDDSDACTQGDFCSGGACVSGPAVVCALPDACHLAGQCNPGSGQCFYAQKQDGAACDDGDACTQPGTCASGVCVGEAPVVCPEPGPCDLAIACDPASGACVSFPKPDGATCNDGDLCTTGDTCVAGACVPGQAVSCGPAPDDCHEPGACDALSGACVSAARPDGASCEGGACIDGACVPADAGAGGGGSSSSSSSGAIASSSSSSSAGGGEGGAPVVEPGEPSGCSCDVPGTRPSALGWLSAMLLALAIRARRRDPRLTRV
jgi:hypothetical protein